MTLLRQVPFDLLKEIVSYLDFDACALIFCTFDRRIQCFFGLKGAVTFLNLDRQESEFFPAHRYLLTSLVGVHSLKIGLSSIWLLKGCNFCFSPKIAPQRLELDISHFSPEISARNIENLSGSLRVLEINVFDGCSGLDSVCALISASSSSLERLRYSICPTRNRGWYHYLDAKALLSSNPMPRLVDLELEGWCVDYLDPQLPLTWFFRQFPHLEKLSLANLWLVHSRRVAAKKMPPSLTHLSIRENGSFSQPQRNPRNACQKGVVRPKPVKDDTGKDWAILLPAPLTHLEVPMSKQISSFPHDLQTLKLESKQQDESLVEILLQRVPKLFSLRALSLRVGTVASLSKAFLSLGYPPSWQCPAWLTHFELVADELDFDSVCSLFGQNQLAQLQGLTLEAHRISMRDITSFIKAFQRLEMKVERKVVLSAEFLLEHSVPILRCSQLFAESGPFALLVELAKLLCLNPATHKVKLCMCRECVSGVWAPASLPLTTVSIPISAFNLASHGLLQFVGEEDGLPLWNPEAETLRQILYENPIEGLYQGPPPDFTTRLKFLDSPSGRTKIWLPPSVLCSDKLKPVHIDFGNVPIYPDDTLWDAIPHSVTYLRSNYQIDAGVSFGGRPTEGSKESKFHHVPSCYYYRFVVLDTPYFVFTLDQLHSICSKDTIRTLRATISDVDTGIFEFALVGCSSFSLLQNVTLRAFPTLSGNLSFNSPNSLSFQIQATEATQALQLAGVHVLQCFARK